MGKSGYTSLSIEEKRYARMRRDFDNIVETEKTYTQWHCDVTEAALDRLKFLGQKYPDLSLVKIIPNGIVIDDSKNDDVVKVIMKDKKIVCSEKKDPERYIQFALLHPEFTV